MPRLSYSEKLRRETSTRNIIPFIGVYDVFSAGIAGKHFDGIFISGFGFAASNYGLPDIGFISWTDIVAFVQRVRTVLPDHHIIVDIDDGYCDVEVACHVVSLLESLGASGVILEDQKRPRKCGHYDGKQLLDLEDYIEKLERVLETRRELFVVARTDAGTPQEVLRRVKAAEAAGADAVLADGLKNLDVLKTITREVERPVMFNQIAGGKSPPVTLTALQEAGVSLVNYSTPCLFSAQAAVEKTMKDLLENDGLLPQPQPQLGEVGVKECTSLLNENLQRRDQGGVDGALKDSFANASPE